MPAKKQAKVPNRLPRVNEGSLKPAAEKPNKTEKPPVVTHEIDATGQILGRMSTEVADLLRGKRKPTFRPNILMGDKVVITNAAKIRVTGTNKMIQKTYHRHSGYLGNLKTATMADLMRTDPSKVLLHSISGMLPKNKLRKEWLKNLTILNASPLAPERSDGRRGEKNG